MKGSDISFYFIMTTLVQPNNQGRREPSGKYQIRYIQVKWKKTRIDRKAGYGEWIGAEYHPRGRTEESLAWMQDPGLKALL
jgi:hydroxypyruvate isomerase